jgi:hypothetical protein
MAFDAVSLESIPRRIPMGASDFNAIAPVWVDVVRWAGLSICLDELARPSARVFRFIVSGSS